MVDKILVFHIYVYDSETYTENIAYKLHMSCLKHYSDVFNKACFNIACENPNNVSVINRVKHDIIDCGFNNLEIIVTHNDVYCEVNTFKHFVLDRIGTVKGLVFFGHTKGIMNVIDGINYPENILKWAYTMYFFNLEKEYVDNMEKRLIFSYGGGKNTFFGTLRQFNDTYTKSFFPGTFYWVNVMKLYEDSIDGTVRIPNIANRNFCEELPYIYENKENSYNGVASCNNIYIGNDVWLYNDNDWNDISFTLSGGDNTSYWDIYNDILSKINVGL